MSLIVEKFLTCDGCGDCYCADELRNDTAKVQRIEAKSDGWIYKRGKDYCEECKMSPNVMFMTTNKGEEK